MSQDVNFSVSKTTKEKVKESLETRFLLRVNVNGSFHRQNVRICTKPCYLPATDRRDKRLMAEFFARMDV